MKMKLFFGFLLGLSSSFAFAGGAGCPLYSAAGRWPFCLISCIAWLLLASLLLYFTWNNVIGSLFKVKKAQYWQALLLVTTILVFCAPRYIKRNSCYKSQASCHHSQNGTHPHPHGDQ